MEDRNYIINRIMSKRTTANEFEYDKLTAPPISSMFTMDDINQLRKIATSVRYAGNPDKKYKLIDEIMKRRGFAKFVSGTNRVSYRCLEDDSFIIKIAFDDVGIKDNPKEFKNQFLLKPFCTKVFEVTPCGTLGVFERVNPITSREEFCSVASDIYNVISYWIIGEYVLEDIGTKFFMNWGVRRGFGPVLLDFPYMYELDGNKLYCKAPAETPSGCCDGIIDYDAGFNYLYCTKCGVRYRATELAKAIENNEIIKGKGETKMKIRVTGGSKNVNRTYEAGQYADMMPSIPRGKRRKNRSSDNKVVVSIKGDKAETIYRSEDHEPSIKVRTVKSTNVEKTVNGVKTDDESHMKHSDQDISFEAVPIEPLDFIKAAMLDLSPESFNDEEIIKEIVNKFNHDTIAKMLPQITVMSTAKTNIINKLSSSDISDIDKTIESIAIASNHILSLIVKDDKILDKFIDLVFYYVDRDVLVGLLTKLINRAFVDKLISMYDNYDRYEFDEDTNKSTVYTDPKIYNEYGDVIYEKDDYEILTMNDVKDNLQSQPDNNNNTEVVKEKSVKPDDKFYTGFKYFSGKIINEKDIFQDKTRSKVLVLVDQEGEMISDNDKIVAVDLIDNKSVDSLSIVSTNWLNPILEKLNHYTEDKDVKEYPDKEVEVIVEDTPEESDDVVYTDESDNVTVADAIPMGIFPPNTDTEYSVNGVKGE